MPLYDDDDVVSEVVTDFGKGRSLKVKLKANASSVPNTRRLFNMYRQAESAQKRIDALRKEQDAEPAKAEQLEPQIAELEKGDMISTAVRLLAVIGETWDYYPDRAAEERGEPYPFNEENIARLSPMHLLRVINNCSIALGLVEDKEDAEEAKKLPETSPAQLTRVVTAPTSSPTGTSPTATIAP